MPQCFFVTDLHGSLDRFERLFEQILREVPHALFLGGDLLPGGLVTGRSLDVSHQDFVNDYLARRFRRLKQELHTSYPEVFVILGNDDPRFLEAAMMDVATRGLWHYVHNRRIRWDQWLVYGYNFVPPTPFMNKDWERYDVSRYVDPGSVSPEEGGRSVPVSDYERRYMTIAKDLQNLTADDDLSRAIMLFHSPPYKTKLDRAALDGKMIDHVPLDVHVGSVAIKNLIEERGPRVTLHGHVHESTRLTGAWQDQMGATTAMSAVHDGPELCLVRFDPVRPSEATRTLL